jgi:hypothetical protein
MPYWSSQFRPLRLIRAAVVIGAASVVTMQASAQILPMDAAQKGIFGPVISWPLIPIHAAVLPDGRVMSYGTDQQGRQGAQLAYDVWSPSKGVESDAHLVLPNRTGTDIFCSGQILLPGSGNLLLTGGDRTVLGIRNFSVRDVNLFDYRTDSLYPAQPMAFQRWYPSVLTLASGEVLVLGGTSDPGFYASTPEVFNETQGWRTLSSATSPDAYGVNNWNYPRAWQAPNGKVFIATRGTSTFYLDATGTGQIERLTTTLPVGDAYLPSVMFAPGKILALRQNNKAVVIDLNGFTPTVTAAAGVGQDRYHGSLTVLPDGRVLASGGSSSPNAAQGVAYAARIWNPATDTWTVAASASQMRLYHSIAMLLPDGRVLTAGGGSPGPVNNLNAEIFSPPYLYKQELLLIPRTAPRPAIVSAPATASWGQKLVVQADVSNIRRATLVRMGSVTHTVDFDQRFVELSFTASKSTLNINMPASPNVAPPGYYILFLLNPPGVPSVGRIIKLG